MDVAEWNGGEVPPRTMCLHCIKLCLLLSEVLVWTSTRVHRIKFVLTPVRESLGNPCAVALQFVIRE